MPTASSLPEWPDLQATDREQIAEIVAALHQVLGQGLVGAYLHGSAVLSGLRAQSDVDVLAFVERRMTSLEKGALFAHLLAMSGTPGFASPRPVELNVTVWSEIRPWRYPPRMDLQYGEWWRERFQGGELEPCRRERTQTSRCS